MRQKLFLNIQYGEIILEIWLFGKYLEGHVNFGDLKRRDEAKAMERSVLARAMQRPPEQNSGRFTF